MWPHPTGRPAGGGGRRQAGWQVGPPPSPLPPVDPWLHGLAPLYQNHPLDQGAQGANGGRRLWTRTKSAIGEDHMQPLAVQDGTPKKEPKKKKKDEEPEFDEFDE